MKLETEFNHSRFQQYADFLKAGSTSSATIDRKLSSLNSFQSFLIKKGYLKNPSSAAPITTNRTIPFIPKNFLSRYLIFGTLIAIILGLGYGLYTQTILRAKQELAYSTATNLVRPGRVFSFQGRLTDTSGNPISSPTDITFKFFNNGVGGSGVALYSSGIGPTITPDENGIFNVVIGKTHGAEIPPEVFSENAEVWLEITADSEVMDPRQQIATVAYALNAETLQGLPPSASGFKNSVLVIGESGNVYLGETSPSIISTSGTFGIEGQALLLKASDSSGGNITINPDGNGIIRFLTEGTTPSSSGFIDLSNNNIAGGNLINSQINNTNRGYNFLSFQNYDIGTSNLSTQFSVGASGNVYISNSLSMGSTILATNLNSDLLDGYHYNDLPYSNYSSWNLLTNSAGTTAITSNANVNFVNGVGISLTQSGSTITINNSSVGTTYAAGSGLTLASDIFKLGGPLTENMRLNIGNTEALFINFTNGFIGIGTTSPREKIDINGALVLGLNSNTNPGTLRWNGSNLETFNASNYWEVLTTGAIVKDPTGFLNRTDTSLSFDVGTTAFTITGTNFKIYISGKEYIKNTESITINPITAGILYYIYYNASGNLTYSTVPWDISTTVQIATLYWTGTTALIGEERHGLSMEGITHEYLHQTVGTRYSSGLTGTFNSPPTFSVTAGSIYDEDIKNEVLGTQTTARVIYQVGSSFVTTAPQSNYFHQVSNVIQYNNSGNIAPVTNNNYVAYWIFATNDPTSPIYSLMGQRQDTSIANARSNATYESLSLGNLPFREMKLLYRVILRLTGGTTESFIEAQDYRAVSNLPSGTYTPSSHSVLTDLTNDDHLQYALLNGRIGGQILSGGTSATETLTLMGSTDPAGGNIYLNPGLGLIGIGTTAPSKKLDIAGDINLTGTIFATGTSGSSGQILTSTGIGLSWVPSTSVGTTYTVTNGLDIITTNTFGLGGTLTQNTRLNIGNTEVLYLQYPSGNVGIGTTSPNGKLEILDNSASPRPFILGQAGTGDAAIQFSILGATNWIMGADNSNYDNFKISTSNALGTSDRLVINTAGNVGIGTTNPLYLLHVGGTGSLGVGGTINFTGLAVGTTGTGTTAVFIDASGNLYKNTLGALAFVDVGTTYTAGVGLTLSNTNIFSLNLGNTNVWLAPQFFNTGIGVTGLASFTNNIVVGGTFVSVGSTNLVTNLNAQYLNGHPDTYFLDLGDTGTFIQILTQGVGISINGTGVGRTIAIDYNATNLQITGNQINTIQDITTTSSLTFAKLGLGSTDALYLLNVGGTSNFIDLFASGRIGIGTTAPSQRLDVVGAGNFSIGLTTPQIQLTAANGTSPMLIGSTSLVTNLNSDLLDGNHASAFVGVGSTGNFITTLTQGVGISINGTGVGRTIAIDYNATNLQITGNQINTIQDITTTSSLTFAKLGLGSTDALYLLNVGGTSNFIDLFASGRIGIGTTAPSQRLDVNGSVNIGGSLAITTNLRVGGTFISVGSTNLVTNLNADLLNGYHYDTLPYDNYNHWDLQSNGIGDTAILSGGLVNFVNGIGISLAQSGSTITIHNNAVTAAYTAGSGLTLVADVFKLGGPLTENMRLNIGSTEVMYFEYATGNVGIGTTNFYEKLTVQGVGNTADIDWVMAAKSPTNAFLTNPYGVGIKLSQGDVNETNKWSGIAAVSESTWANNSGLALYANEAERVRISNSGNFGIGTTNPISKLHVIGDIEMGDGSTTQSLYAYNSDRSYYGQLELYNLATGNATLTTSFDSGDIILLPGTSGNVGIGTTDPSTKLNVVETDGSKNISSFTNSANSRTSYINQWGDIYTDPAAALYTENIKSINSANNLNITSDGNGHVVLQNNVVGNVGIGTTAPAKKLDITGDINLTGTIFAIGITGTNGQVLSSDGAGGLTWITPVGGGIGTTYAAGSGLTLVSDTFELGGAITENMRLNIGNTEVMYFDYATGNIGVGTTSPGSQLTISGAGSATHGLRLTDTTANKSFLIRGDGTNFITGTESANAYTFYTDSLERMRIDANGFIGIGTTAPNQMLEVSGNIAAQKYLDLTGQTEFFLDLANSDYNSSSLSLDRRGSIKWNAKYDVGTSLWTTIDLGIASKIENQFGGLLFATSIGDTSAGSTITDWNQSLFLNNTGNVGIGTTDPQAKLEIAGSTSTITNTAGDITISAASGSISFNGNSLTNILRITAGSGSLSAPTYSFSSDTDTGMYAGGVNIIRLGTGGTDRVTVDASGSVGIGTTAPSQMLEVTNNIAAQKYLDLTGQTEFFLDLANSDYNSTSLSLDRRGSIKWNAKYDVGNTVWTTIDSGATSKIENLFTGLLLATNIGTTSAGSTITNWNTHLFLNQNGNTGVGTTAPTEKLDVIGSIKLTNNLIFTPQNTVTGTTTPGTVYFDTGSYAVGTSDSTGHLYLQGNDNAWHRIALDMTKYSVGSTAVANTSYVEIVHNQATNDLSLTGWFKDTISGLWKTVSGWANTIVNNLGNQFNPEFTQKNKVTAVSLQYQNDSIGTGADGAAVFSINPFNTNNTNLTNNCTTDGGDMVNYSVTALTSTSATLESSPGLGCIEIGDEVLLINLRGAASAYGNVGNWETLRVASVTTNTVTFTTAKTKYYGNGTDSDDTNIGVGTGAQAVMLQRVPNYTTVTVNTGVNVSPSTWVIPSGSNDTGLGGAGEGGVLFFRATGTVSINGTGTINANSLGYRGGAANGNYQGGSAGEAFCSITGGGRGGNYNTAGTAGLCGGGGGGGSNVGTGYAGAAGTIALGGGGGGGGGGYDNVNGSYGGAGGGGGYGSAGALGSGGYNGTSGGTNSSGDGGAGWPTTYDRGGGGGGGGTYGDVNLNDLYFGSGGAAGGGGLDRSGGAGGAGGGIVYIAANSVVVSGGVQSNGGGGGASPSNWYGGGGGGGAGGSVKIVGNILNIGSSLVTASSGAAGTSGAYNGGAGGTGRIAANYGSAITGVSSPAYAIAQVSTNNYSIFVSDEINTPNAVDYRRISWLADQTPFGIVQVQTRSGASNNSTDGSWETWKPAIGNTATTVMLDDANDSTKWVPSDSTITVSQTGVARDVNEYEDEDESTIANMTKLLTTTNANTYAENRLTTTDLTNFDFLTAWVYASASGNSVKLGFGENNSTEHETLLNLAAADTWQKVYIDISHIPFAERDAVRYLRFTSPLQNNTIYIDNIRAERLLNTPSGSAIASTPNNYLQYRIILASSDPGYKPTLYNIQAEWSDGFKIQQTDNNTVRLYNYTGTTQELRLDAVVFGADLAEWYTVNDQTIGAADVVALTGQSDTFGVPILRRATGPDDKGLIGAISTQAGKELGLPADDRRLLGLTGRIPIKIDPQSKSITSGDYLTASSDKPGYAIKAQPGDITIAKAFQSWSPSQGEGAVLSYIIQPQNTPLFNLASLGNYIIEKTGGGYYTVKNTAEDIIIKPTLALAEAVIGNLTAGKIKTDEFIAIDATITNLKVNTVLSDSVATSFLSPPSSDSAIIITRNSASVSALPTTAVDPLLFVDGELAVATISANNIFVDTITANTIVGLDDKIDEVFVSTNGQIAVNFNISDEILTSLGYSDTKNEIEAATYSLTDSTSSLITRVGEFAQVTAAKINTGLLSAKNILADNLAAKKIVSETIITGDITSTTANITELTAQKIGASEATFSTIYADQIINPEGNISDVLATKISNLREEIKSMIASSSAVATPSAIALDALTWDTSVSTDSADLSLDSLTLTNNLIVGAQLLVQGQTKLNSVNVSNILTVGQIALQDNILETTADNLYVQPSGLGTIRFLNDRLVLSSNGNVTINGNLNINGSLVANLLKVNDIETKNLTAEKINIALPAIASASAGPLIATDATTSATTSSDQLVSNATVGTATLAAGQTEITIPNSRLTPTSMVYLTPVGSTGNQVVYLKSKFISPAPTATIASDSATILIPSNFTIAIDTPLTQDIEINWWLIN